MRPCRLVFAMLAVGLLAGDGWAGVYNLDDPLPQHLPPLPLEHDKMQLVLGPLRAAGMPRQPNMPVSPYQEQATELEKKAAHDLTTRDRINLGACYIRLNRPNEAIRVLSEGDQADFMLLANLAGAYFAINEFDRAVSYEQEALSAWPTVQPGWTGAELIWYRRAEGFYLKLLQSRLRDSRTMPGNKPPETMDLLFDKPRRAGARYEARELPWNLWGDLPPDAYFIVSQLLLWKPDDDRLYWQLGEILNSIGYVAEAAKVFNELADTRHLSGVPEFMDHRRVLTEEPTQKMEDALTAAYKDDPPAFQRDFNNLALLLSPRGILLAPGAGDACNAIVQAEAVDQFYQQSQPQPAGPPQAAPPTGWRLNWQSIFVGFAAGLIIATLVALQWTEWRRRRLAAAPAVAPFSLPATSQPTEPAVHDAGAIRTDAPAAPHRMEGTP